MLGETDKVRRVSRRLLQNLLVLAAVHFVFAGALLYALYAPRPELLWLGLYGLIVCAPVGGLMTFLAAQEDWSGETSAVALIAIFLVLAVAAGVVWYLV